MKTTKYLRKALAAQISPRIDIKNDDLYITNIHQVSSGNSFGEYYDKLFKENEKRRPAKEPSKDAFEILIALKTILPRFEERSRNTKQPDELTCVFFVPAMLHKGGFLAYNDGKLPWFVREFMEPMIEAELSIGNAADIDAFLSQTAAERRNIRDWNDYWIYTCSMYHQVTRTDVFELSVPNMPEIRFDTSCYIVKDSTVIASRGILALYDAILGMSSVDNLLLYRSFTSLKEALPRPMVKNSTEMMSMHSGQMGCDYPLSPSQRESLNHLSLLHEGEILAVSGPPGTGKTTLLQSVVADLVTKRALNQEDAPIIVASSTNNQAVTNIIDSFSKLNPTSDSGLDTRWITVAKSFATYFPSLSKKRKVSVYQIDDVMIKTVNRSDIRDESEKKILRCCGDFFDCSMDSISDCKAAIYRELKQNEELKRSLLNKHAEILVLAGGSSAFDFLQNQSKKIQNAESQKKQAEQEKDYKLNRRSDLCSRLTEWENSYRSQVSWFVRAFSFVPAMKSKIVRWTVGFKSEREIVDIPTAQIPKDIFCYYQIQIQSIDDDIRETAAKITEIESNINRLKERVEQLKALLQEATALCDEIQNLTAYKEQTKQLKTLLKKTIADIDETQNLTAYEERAKQLKALLVEKITSCNDETQSLTSDEPPKNFDIVDLIVFSTTEQLNKYIDVSLRWRSYWLAVHYYECVWIETKPIDEDDLFKTTYPVLTEKYRQLAMLSPCFVMTFYMLPSKMRTYNGNFLMKFIDLLIVDEAGQTSPEVAAASFALARKAIVVGDEYQIPPVWGLTPALDTAIAMDCDVIERQEDFDLLVKRGLNASQSSVMKLALNSCPYHKYDKGLFLSEHRRCYNEIIGYCNDLVYKKRLEPCRGEAKNDEKRPSIMGKYPIIGYHNVPVAYSEKAGSSRKNAKEAEEIAHWIKAHFNEFTDAYCGVKDLEEKDVIAVITPFKAQANEIRKQLRKSFGSEEISVEVGTVHTFQGAERKILIFSTTYGAAESGFFIEKNANLMNVAVSRAKDAFWVFGSIDCLKSGEPSTAKGLMYQYVKDHSF